MNFSVLFDLDGTLLQNDDSIFIPAYINLLGNFISKDDNGKNIKEAVIKATQIMVDNNDPTKTLEDCFDSFFYPKIGLSKNDLQFEIDRFYQDFFPNLRRFTKEIPEAKSLSRNLLENGSDLVIATNPLFPKIAIQQRVKWANLLPQVDEFKIITSYENFHFAKPNPAYYAEILANIGWPDGQVVMIGNDFIRDIVPAEKIGIPSFYLGKVDGNQNDLILPKSSYGDWNNLSIWLERRMSDINPLEPENSFEAYIAILLSTAAYLDNFRRSSSTITYWKLRPFPNEWSLLEIITHLADVDSDVNLPRMNLIQIEKNPFFPAISTDEWANERNYLQKNPDEEIDRFLQNRKLLINLLVSFTNHDLEKQVNHAIFGPTKILEIIKFITQHDRIHINQIHKTISQINSENI